MKNAPAIGTAFALVLALLPVGRVHAQTAARCGSALRWKMPTATIVHATEGDSRTHDVRMTQARIDAIVLAAEAYCQLSGGRYPANFEDMMHPASTIAEGMRECRLDRHAVMDAWDRPIFFAVSANRLIVVSAGPDGVFTTADDIELPIAGERHAESFDWRSECTSGR